MKTIIQQIKEKMETATLIEAYALMVFYSDNAGSTRNKTKSRRYEAYALKIQKLGEKRFGANWWQ